MYEKFSIRFSSLVLLREHTHLSIPVSSLATPTEAVRKQRVHTQHTANEFHRFVLFTVAAQAFGMNVRCLAFSVMNPLWLRVGLWCVFYKQFCTYRRRRRCCRHRDSNDGEKWGDIILRLIYSASSVPFIVSRFQAFYFYSFLLISNDICAIIYKNAKRENFMLIHFICTIYGLDAPISLYVVYLMEFIGFSPLDWHSRSLGSGEIKAWRQICTASATIGSNHITFSSSSSFGNLLN